jgi:peroxiredoxin
MGAMPGSRSLARTLPLALAACMLSGAAAPPPRGGLAHGATAPALSLPDVNGREVRLKDLRGKVVVVNFWASWCAPCLEEAPELAAFWTARHGPCLEVLGVAEESGEAAEVENAAAMLRLPYPVLVDDEGEAADRYRVPGYPYTFVVDGRGKIRRVFDGAVTAAALEAAVDPLLAAAGPSCHPR